MCTVGRIHNGISLSSSWRFSHLHWTHTVNDCRGVLKCLLGIFCRECVKDVVSSLGYIHCFLRHMWGCMFWTGSFKFRWSRGYIHNSSYYRHHIGNIDLSIVVIFSVVVCLGWLYHHVLSVSYITGDSWVLFLLILCSLMTHINNRVH